MKYFFLILAFFYLDLSFGQTIVIPEKIEFAGMQLRLSESVRRALKADIEMITKNQKYFQQKVDRANLYFPIIENIFKEVGFPDEFKYLALQESSLIPDAISSSKAVGYWQFKKESAQEVGLRVDHMVDERMNIIASSRGAAAYLKKNNATLNNWVYALLSYNVGLGGVKPMVKEKYRGATHMEIDDHMHWYVIRFLAHKLAFENAVGKTLHPSGLVLIEDRNSGNKSLEEISQLTSIDYPTLQSYNKWLLSSKIPNDKIYSVILPVASSNAPEIITVKNDHPVEKKTEPTNYKIEKVKPKNKSERNSSKKIYTEPPVEVISTGSDVAMLVFLNRIKAIKAKEGDDIPKLSMKAGIPIENFLVYNDLRRFDKIIPNNFYYLQPKRTKALVLKHTVMPNETLWDISQKYGIQIRAIRKKNRMGRTHNPETGRVLWLRMKRPKNIPVEVVNVVKEEINKPKEIKKEVVSEPQVENKISSPDSVIHVTRPLTPDSATHKILSDGLTDKTHIVKAGETMYSISKQYQVSIDSLKKWNGLYSNDLKLGQELNINVKPGSITPLNAYKTHIVKAGETIYKISREYGVSIEEILLWNNKKDNNVSIGEELTIKK